MIRLRSAAKLNLTLEITGRRDDGYHELKSVVQTVSLWDELTLQPTQWRDRLSCNRPELEGEHNLCLRAASLLRRHTNTERFVDLTLTKQIPVGAGLGGGSGNAAATLVGLNQLWDLGLSVGDLAPLGAQLGADVPLFLTGGTQLMSGVGDRLLPLPAAGAVWFVIAKGEDSVATAWAYAAYDENPVRRQVDHASLVRNLAVDAVDKAGPMFQNLLESAVFRRYPSLSALKQQLLQSGAAGAAMTGSGAAVFGAFPSKERAAAAEKTLANTARNTWVVRPTATGVEFLPSGTAPYPR